VKKLDAKDLRKSVRTRLVMIGGKTLSIPESIYENFESASVQELALWMVDPSESTRLLAEWFLKRKT
jgi:hypothetical protein